MPKQVQVAPTVTPVPTEIIRMNVVARALGVTSNSEYYSDNGSDHVELH